MTNGKLPKINVEKTGNVPREGDGETISSKPKNLARTHDAPQQMLIRPELREKALQALEDGLAATKRFFNKEAGGWIAEPDYQTRVKSAELVLAYDVGRPVERKVELKGSFTGYDEKLEKLCATPEGLAAAIKLGLVTEERALKAENVELGKNPPKPNAKP